MQATRRGKVGCVRPSSGRASAGSAACVAGGEHAPCRVARGACIMLDLHLIRPPSGRVDGKARQLQQPARLLAACPAKPPCHPRGRAACVALLHTGFPSPPTPCPQHHCLCPDAWSSKQKPQQHEPQEERSRVVAIASLHPNMRQTHAAGVNAASTLPTYAHGPVRCCKVVPVQGQRVGRQLMRLIVVEQEALHKPSGQQHKSV